MWGSIYIERRVDLREVVYVMLVAARARVRVVLKFLELAWQVRSTRGLAIGVCDWLRAWIAPRIENALGARG